jgi:hypothetical protein
MQTVPGIPTSTLIERERALDASDGAAAADPQQRTPRSSAVDTSTRSVLPDPKTDYTGSAGAGLTPSCARYCTGFV